MKEYPEKAEIISLISKSLKECPHTLQCVGLFGSFIKKKNFRDIDILVIVPSKEALKTSEQWMKENIQPLLKVPIDVKCYDFESFLGMTKNNSPLTLSIAVEVEFIIANSTIEREITSLKEYLLKQCVNVSNNQTWKVNPKVLNNLLSKENEVFRGFLVSHLDWIENHMQEAEKLLRVLIPIEEPYTRVACFKQVNNLLLSEEYRKKLNISMSKAIDFANQLLSNRKYFDLSQFEDYSSQDLCLDLLNILKKLPSDMWFSIEVLFRRLVRDYNHLVRQGMIEFIHNEMLLVNSGLGYTLLVEAFNFEHKYWILHDICDKPFLKKDIINIEHLILLLQGYIQVRYDDREMIYHIEKLAQALHNYLSLGDKQKFDSLLEISEKITEFKSLIGKINNTEYSYVSRVLNNVKAEAHKTISGIVIQKGKFNVKYLHMILEQVPESIPTTTLLDSAKKLNDTHPDGAEYYRYAVELCKAVKQIQLKISAHSLKETVLDSVLVNMANFLEQYIKGAKCHLFFSVVPKPKFGLKQNQRQHLKFVTTNLTSTTIPDVKLDIQSSAEIEITSGSIYKTYEPSEQSEVNCWVKPLVSKQIAISYKINGDFGKPIYVSADRANPFVPNKPAFSAHFVGRETELQLIREEIYQQHFLLFGPRRIGKTSVLYQLKEELTEGYLPIYISLQKFDIVDGTLLFDKLIQDITRELAILKNFSVQDLETTDDRLNKIKNSLDDQRLLLLIDEMDVGQEVNNFSSFLERMRAMMQQESSIRVVFSSGPFITKDLVNSKSPLFNMVKHISVNRLTPEASEKLLRLAEDQDIIFENGIIEECLKWTGNLPLYLQILGDHIYQTLKDKDISDRKVSQAVLTQIKHTMKSDIVEWERIWNVLNRLEKALLAFHAYNRELVDVSQIKNNIEQIYGQALHFIDIREGLKNLVWYGFLNEHEGRYKLTAGLLQDWLINCLYYPEEIQELFVTYGDEIK